MQHFSKKLKYKKVYLSIKMYKLLMDADALIKLASSGALPKICEVCVCITTPEVERETVVEGKKRWYPDAEIIEALIEKQALKIKKLATIPQETYSLDAGETSILHLSKELKEHIIVSDDQTFIREMERQGVHLLVPADLLILLTRAGKIEPKETVRYAEGLKVYIRETDYLKLKKEIKG